MRALTLCAGQGCDELVVRGKCPACQDSDRKALNLRRGGKQDSHVERTERHWRMTRASYLKRHPRCECEECVALPYAERPAATDVHHVVDRAEGGDSSDANLRAYAHAHHSRVTAQQQPRLRPR